MVDQNQVDKTPGLSTDPTSFLTLARVIIVLLLKNVGASGYCKEGVTDGP